MSSFLFDFQFYRIYDGLINSASRYPGVISIKFIKKKNNNNTIGFYYFTLELRQLTKPNYERKFMKKTNMENITKSTRLTCDISSKRYINRGVVIERLSLVSANDYSRFFEMCHIFDSIRSGMDIIMFPRTGRHSRNSKKTIIIFKSRSRARLTYRWITKIYRSTRCENRIGDTFPREDPPHNVFLLTFS